MRLRNIKNKEEIIKNSPYIVENSENTRENGVNYLIIIIQYILK